MNGLGSWLVSQESENAIEFLHSPTNLNPLQGNFSDERRKILGNGSKCNRSHQGICGWTPVDCVQFGPDFNTRVTEVC